VRSAAHRQFRQRTAAAGRHRRRSQRPPTGGRHRGRHCRLQPNVHRRCDHAILRHFDRRLPHGGAAGADDGAAGLRARAVVRPAGAAALSRLSLPRPRGNAMTINPIIRLLPVCAMAALVSQARGETLDELYQKAKAEKEVVFYSGGPAAPHENRAKLFTQQFPGIEVKVTGGFSNVLNEKIEQQMAEKKLAVDMAFFQTVQDFVKWKAQGKLLNFKPDGFEQILPNFRDQDGAYMALSANALTYAYNTAKVSAQDA